MLRLYLFGAPRLERAGMPVTTDTRKAIALLAYLVVTQRGHTRDTLATLLWGDADEQHARGALRRTLSVLRSAAGEDAVETAGDMIAAGAGVWCDVLAFRAALRAGDGEVERAAELAAGPFMSGFNLRDAPDFEEWQFLEGEALGRELAAGLTRLAAGLAAAGNYAAAIGHGRRLLSLDPLNEEAHRLLMRLHAYNGDQSAALRQYRECARVLEQELGVPPLPETSELYHAIRENRLSRPAAATVAQAPAPSTDAAPQVARGPRPLALVGRSAEWSTLVRIYQEDGGRGSCVALEGEAGIGKTRLAEDFIAFARAAGASVAVGRCFEGETGLAYGVVTEVLRRLLEGAGCADRLAALTPVARTEAARLLPELQTATPPAPASDPGAGRRFLDGLSQFLTGLCPRQAPAVLFFDDLHWVDEASLDFLTYFARRLAGRPVLLILSWRSDGSPQVERLRLLLTELSRAGHGTLLRLPRLGLADVLSLVPDRAGKAVGERIYRESEGVPLFVAAFLEAATFDGSELPGLPPTVRDLLAARLAAIGEAERQLLQAAAVLGRSFDLDVLQATSGRSFDETLSGVERLVERGLVREATGQRAGAIYDFDHEKLRELAYETVGAGRRRLLHERAARAWLLPGARQHPGDLVAPMAAYHFEMAGRSEEAAEQHVAAAQQAERVYANADAIHHYRAALELGYGDPAALHEAIADLEALRGNYSAAQAAYEAAASRLVDGAQTGRLEHKLANLYARLGAWEAADSYYATADEALRSAPEAIRAGLYSDWALAAHQRGDAARASDLVRRALEEGMAAGEGRALAQAYNILGVVQRKQGDLLAAIESLEAGCASAERLGDSGAHAAALNNLALAVAESGDLERGVSLLRAALIEATRRGDRHREAALRNNLADLLHAQGREEESMAELKQAVALFAEIGAQAGESQAEIWRLTEW